LFNCVDTKKLTLTFLFRVLFIRYLFENIATQILLIGTAAVGQLVFGPGSGKKRRKRWAFNQANISEDFKMAMRDIIEQLEKQ